MEERVTIPLRKEDYLPLSSYSSISIGNTIFLEKDSYWPFVSKLKPRFMVARLKKVKFRPKFGVFLIDSSIPYQHTITFKPINF